MSIALPTSADQSDPQTASETNEPALPSAAHAVTLFVLVVAILYFGKEVLVPVVLALLLAFILAPVVGFFRRIRLGRVPSVLLAVLIALTLVLAIGGVIGTQVAQLTANLPTYVQTIEKKVETVRAATIGRLTDFAGRIGKSGTADAPGSPAAQTSAQNNENASPDNGRNSIGALTELANNPLGLASHYISPVLAPLATLGIVFVVTIFALLQQEDLRDRLIRLLGSRDLHRTTLAIDDAGRRLGRYFLAQLCLNAAFGVVVTIGLVLIGVPNPILFGILSALLRFVPYVGSFVSAILPMALAAAVAPGWSMLLWTFGLYVVTETLAGQVIEPLLYGHSTGLSPFSVVVAAIFWSWVWGPIGLILSMPLTLCLVVLGRHVEQLEVLEILLGDRPALTPVESFYQRILAGDPDEVQDHAETILKEHSLSTYYDEVALKGLQLAVNDAGRGVLNPRQLNHIKETILDLVGDLDGFQDVPPASAGKSPSGNTAGVQASDVSSSPQPADAPQVGAATPWASGNPVLCIAGRGPLDEAAASMLVQLLGKHGISGELVRYGAVARDRINSLDTGQAKMVCISYLDISGNPAHLRYLLQRLRRKLPPGTPILVGLWPSNDAAVTDPRMRKEIGADYYTRTLAEAVSACAGEAVKDSTPGERGDDVVEGPMPAVAVAHG